MTNRDFEIPKIIYYFNQETLNIDTLNFVRLDCEITNKWKNVEYVDDKNKIYYISYYYIPILGWNVEYDYLFNPNLEKLKEKAYLKQLSDKDYKEAQIETFKNDITRIEQNIKYLKSIQK